MAGLDNDENPDPDYSHPELTTDGEEIVDYQPVVLNRMMADEFDNGQFDGGMLSSFSGKFIQGEQEIKIDLSQVTYKGDYPHRGYFVIFNHINFAPKSKYHNRPRRGSDSDVARLKKLFTELGFDVRVYKDK